MSLQPPHPEKIDQLLAQHLASALEPQRGKALAAFRAATSNGNQAPDGNPGLSPASAEGRSLSVKRLMFKRFAYGTVSSLLAACIAVVATLHFTQPGPQSRQVVEHPGPLPTGQVAMEGAKSQPAPTNTGGGTLVFDPVPINQVNVSRQIDGGVTLLEDNTPVRIIRQQDVHQTQWTDPHDNATYTITQPVDKVGYVKVQPY